MFVGDDTNNENLDRSNSDIRAVRKRIRLGHNNILGIRTYL